MFKIRKVGNSHQKICILVCCQESDGDMVGSSKLTTPVACQNH